MHKARSVGGTFSIARRNLKTDNGEGSERCGDAAPGVPGGVTSFGITLSGVTLSAVTSYGVSVGDVDILLLFQRPFPEPRVGLRVFFKRGGVMHSSSCGEP